MKLVEITGLEMAGVDRAVGMMRRLMVRNLSGVEVPLLAVVLGL